MKNIYLRVIGLASLPAVLLWAGGAPRFARH
jgi:hypothetical protein